MVRPCVPQAAVLAMAACCQPAGGRQRRLVRLMRSCFLPPRAAIWPSPGALPSVMLPVAPGAPKVAVVDGLVGLATLTALARATSPDRRAAVVAGMLGACLPDSDKPSTLFFGRSPFPAWVDEAHKRIQNEAHERMPYEALGGVIGALVGRAWLRRR